VQVRRCHNGPCPGHRRAVSPRHRPAGL